MKCLNIFSVSILLFLATTYAQASVVNWEIKFFNDNGTQVGNGGFNFDSDTTSTLLLERPPGGPGSFTEVEVNNLIKSYDFSVLNRVWSSKRSPTTKWWGKSFESGGSIIFTRDGNFTGPFLLGESQFLQGGFAGNTFLRLGFDNATKTDKTATGTWIQEIGFSSSDSGTWSAKAIVPIPGTFLLFGSGLVGLMLGKRKNYQL